MFYCLKKQSKVQNGKAIEYCTLRGCPHLKRVKGKTGFKKFKIKKYVKKSKGNIHTNT